MTPADIQVSNPMGSGCDALSGRDFDGERPGRFSVAAKYANKPPPRYQEDDRFRKYRSDCDRRKSFVGEHGADMTDDEFEFAYAMVYWRNRNHRQPDCREVLQVLKSLGYRKDESCQSQTQ